MESDLGTRLDWVGIAHWNTDNPHVHPVVCGVADDGCDLLISPDYISHGPRSRAADLVSSELRSKPGREIRSALAREVEAERWTRFGLRLYQVRQPRVSVARSRLATSPRSGMIHSTSSATSASRPSLSPAADRGEEVLHGLDVLLGTPRNFSISLGSDRARSDRRVVSLPVGTSCSSVELNQVLKDQLTPAISARLD